MHPFPFLNLQPKQPAPYLLPTMAALNSPLLLLLLATITILHTTAAPAPTFASPSLVGGYTPIPIDHHVEELAKFAINEHIRQAHDDRVYSKTLRAERQVVSGYNYSLIISALRHGVANNYQAVVYVPLGSSAKPQLTWFKSLLQTAKPTTTTAIAAAPASPPLRSGYKPILIGHHVEELAKFAINEHNRQEHDHLVYSKTLKAERQLVNGNNYRLVISALQDKVVNNYQAVVCVPFGIGPKPQHTSFKPLLQTATATTTATASPPLVGGYTTIPIDHYEEELAKFAIDEHNR